MICNRPQSHYKLSTTGFTLIELLVVVLIIGIIAAIALPQYQLAVQKSKFAQLEVFVKPIKNALELYYTAHSQYPTSLDDIDITLPQDFSTCPTDKLDCARTNGNITIDLYDGTTNNIIAYHKDRYIGYMIYLNHSNAPNKKFCYANNNCELCNKTCIAMGGVSPTGLGDWGTRYLLP
jgi:prepilin-type N-terminal cleavage/methylation domain-containing protein